MPTAYIAIEDRAERERITSALHRRDWSVVAHATGFHLLSDLADVIEGRSRELPALIVVDVEPFLGLFERGEIFDREGDHWQHRSNHAIDHAVIEEVCALHDGSTLQAGAGHAWRPISGQPNFVLVQDGSATALISEEIAQRVLLYEIDRHVERSAVGPAGRRVLPPHGDDASLGIGYDVHVGRIMLEEAGISQALKVCAGSIARSPPSAD